MQLVQPDIRIIQILIKPLLWLLRDIEDHRLNEIKDSLKRAANLTEKQEEQISWALSFLKQIDLIDDPEPRHGYHKITDVGYALISERPGKIDYELLFNRFPEIEFKLSDRFLAEFHRTYPGIFDSLSAGNKSETKTAPQKEAPKKIVLPLNIHISIDDSGFKRATIPYMNIKAVYGIKEKMISFFDYKDFSTPSVYFLFGNQLRKSVYIGETEKLQTRLLQHSKDDNKKFWKYTVAFSSVQFNQAQVRHIEKKFIDAAYRYRYWRLENDSIPQTIYLPESEIKELNHNILPALKSILGTFDMLH